MLSLIRLDSFSFLRSELDNSAIQYEADVIYLKGMLSIHEYSSEHKRILPPY